MNVDTCPHGNMTAACKECLVEGLRQAVGRDRPTSHVDWQAVAELDGDLGGVPVSARPLVQAATSAVVADFPPNAVPDEVVAVLEVLANLAAEQMAAVGHLGRLMIAELERQGRNANGTIIKPEIVKKQKEALDQHLEFQRKTAHRPDPADIKRRP